MAFIDISTLDPAKTIVVSTGNAHKVIEIEEILGKVLPEVRFVALGELGDFPDAVEDGETFFDNALIKARYALACTGLAMAVADDSGLCVDALGGAPGVWSARWAGEHGADDANNEKLIPVLGALLAVAWNADDWTFEALAAHYHTLVRYLNLRDCGRVPSRQYGYASSEI